jgi:hypothetical protein
MDAGQDGEEAGIINHGRGLFLSACCVSQEVNIFDVEIASEYDQAS